MAKIGSPRASASCTAANSQRSRSGSICLSSTEGSTTFWRKNSGEISEPPVSKRPSICSKGTFRFLAFQTLISGCLRKIGRNHFASFARIHVARLGIGEFATSHRVCKEHSMSHVDVSSALIEDLERLTAESKARASGVALHDLESGLRFSLRGDRWFHAASTIKVAVLLAVFRAADEGRFRLDDSLHVRNRFISAADGSSFHVSPDRDATPELYQAIGRTAKISALAHAMISGSSNLATNLLLDFVGVEYARKVLRDAEVHEVELRRGVEDHAAHERGINNEATANGLVTLLSAIRGDFLTDESKQEVIRILLKQRFNPIIPARLRKSPRIADSNVTKPLAVASLFM